MRTNLALCLVAAAGLASCGRTSDSAAGSPRSSAAAQCQILTVADIQAVTGSTVMRVERGAVLGAGGTCANFATADSHAYLGVNHLASQSEYASSVGAVPADVYPTKEPVAGLGDEAVLFKGPGGLRYLVARQGGAGVVLFPMGEGANMSDQQLHDLASRALAARQ